MIHLIKSRSEFSNLRKAINGSIGLVPTMGNLHSGHLGLLNKALKENDCAIITIFVNPTQFGPTEDFDKYPRTLEQDVEKIKEMISLEKIEKPIYIFAPSSTTEVYGHSFRTFINVAEITDVLCGAKRPGHFQGVATVVYKLFSLTKPTRAYFGQKDYQQVLVIKTMVKNLDLDLEIVTCDIARSAEGLALSSRNQYLSDDEKILALHLNKTLNRIKSELQKGSYTDAFAAINLILEEEQKDSRWDYLEILDANNLKEVGPETNQVVVAGAYKINQTRLIDNQLVDIIYA